MVFNVFFNEKQNFEVFSLGSLATAAQNKNVNSATLQRCGSFYAAFQTLGSSVAHSMQRVRSNIIFLKRSTLEQLSRTCDGIFLQRSTLERLSRGAGQH